MQDDTTNGRTDRRTYLKALGAVGTLGVAGSGTALADQLDALNSDRLTAMQATGMYTQTAELTTDDAAARDYFGDAVSVDDDGTAALVGAPGDDYDIFNDNRNFRIPGLGSAYFYPLYDVPPIASRLIASDAARGDTFGDAVSVSGDGTTVLIGTPNDDDGFGSGSAYVYDLTGNGPDETELIANDAAIEAAFGEAVSMNSDGTMALVGAPFDNDDGDRSGSAYLYYLSGASPFDLKLTANDAAGRDRFGRSVSVSGDGTTALVGAPRNDDDGLGSGAAYVYDLSVSPPTEMKLTASDAASGDDFGWSVSVSDDGTTALVGSLDSDTDAGLDSGAVYVYDLSGDSPIETKLTASDAHSGDHFGLSVSMSGDGTTALVGAPDDNTAAIPFSGSAYIYDLSGSSPTQTAKLTANDATAGDGFGYAVAVNSDGTMALVGAPSADDDGEYSGSAYVFTRVPNQSPTAAFSYDPANATVGEAVTFDASGSSDDSAIASYEWDFDDGETTTGKQVRHTFDAAGDYDVTLTVTDDAGASDTMTKTVAVVETVSDNVISFKGVGETVRYAFAVTGSIGENEGVEQQWADHIEGTTGGGVVGPSRDSYTFTGELVRLKVSGQAKVLLNADEIKPAKYPDNIITFEGVGETVRYEFAATGSVGENSGVEQQWADRIEGTTGSGVVGPSRDSYTFTGDLRSLTVDGEAVVTVNGEEVDENTI